MSDLIEREADPLFKLLIRARDRSPVGQIMAGAALPIHALRFLKRFPALWPLVVMPALINMLLFGLGAYIFITYAGDWLGLLWQKPDAAVLVGLWYVFYILSLLFGIVLTYVIVLFASSIIASPFHDKLSEHTEKILLRADAVSAPDIPFIQETIRSYGSSALIALSYAAVMAPVIWLNMIPVAGSAAASVVGGLVSACFLSLEFTDPILGRRGLKLGQKFRLIGKNFWLCGPFGFATSLCLWVPLLNFFTMPLAVVGGTALGAALLEPASQESERDWPDKT